MENNHIVSNFLNEHFKHFNAGTLIEAARQYKMQKIKGNKMLISLAGAMSTAEIGKTLAEMIRKKMVDIICTTAANLKEDIMNLVAHKSYKKISNYRSLSNKNEKDLLLMGLNRVTDTCIPEKEALRKLESHVVKIWLQAANNKQRFFPHEYFYQMLLSGVLEKEYEINPKDSWVLSAAINGLPIIVPGWEDSSLGNIFAAECIKGKLNPGIIKSGIEYMVFLADWYKNISRFTNTGFLQIGGGIAGDFAICVVPMLKQDLELNSIPYWSYFCQISDSTTSYGGYSGATPNEKISWGKLDIGTPSFIIESDATIVAPLMFAYILDW